MAKPISLEVITSTETSVKEDILELYIPAYHGEAGILENHLPYITILKFGEISYKDLEGNLHYLYIENGFMEVKDNIIVVISDLAIKGEDINIQENTSLLEVVTKRIKSAVKGEINAEELEDAIYEQKRLLVKSEIIKKISAN